MGFAVVIAAGGCAARAPSVPARAEAAAGCSVRTPARCEAPCFAGDGAACTIFGEAAKGTAEAPVRLPQDMPRARKALDHGCQLGNLDACRGRVDIDDDSLPPGAACADWEGLCKRGNRPSCTFFAMCLDHDDHFRRDRSEALRLFRDGCAAGERFACRELGFHVMEGDGVPKDLPTGFGLLDRACGMDDPYACAHVGLRLEIGQGAPRDLGRAKALYRMACARGIRPIPCEGLRRLGEEPPSTVASSADATESIHVSQRFDWEWRLPANWQFVPPGSLPLADAPAEAEVVAARLRDGAERESLTFVVGACAQDASAPYEDRHRATLATAARNAKAWLAGHGVGNATSAPSDFWGTEAVRVDGRLAPPDGRHLTVMLLCKQDKLFEMRCLSPRSTSNIPCSDGFGALMVHEPKRAPNENARVLHLRDKRLGIAFDAPDDSWLVIGPNIRGGQVDWRWGYGERNIDLMVAQVGAISDETFDQMSNIWARIYPGRGTATRMQSELGGAPCVHIVIDERDGRATDIFIQRRGDVGVMLTVGAPKRDAELVAKARAGLRFDEAAR